MEGFDANRLWERVRRVTDKALGSGALLPVATAFEYL